MSTYRYAVRTWRAPDPYGRPLWCSRCICGWTSKPRRELASASRVAINHTATCMVLRRANWDAACPSCKFYGMVAAACPVCLGRGWVKEVTQ